MLGQLPTKLSTALSEARWLLKLYSRIAPPELTPIILTSLGRTGTTLCMKGLSHHPEIAALRIYPYEAKIAQEAMASLQKVVNSAGLECLSPQVVLRTGNRQVDEAVTEFTDYVRAYYSIMALLNRQPGARYFVEKFLPFRTQEWFFQIYPNSRQLFLVRDFRDMLRSILAFNKKRGYQGFTREHFSSDLEFVRHLSGPRELLAAWQENRDKALLVRYEDLVRQQEREFTSIFRYLGVDASEPLVRWICSDKLRPSQRLQNVHLTSASSQASINRWRTELSPELIEAAHETFGDVLEAFGYQVS